MSRLVEKIGEDRYRFNANYKRIWQKLMEYEEIGTIEEFKAIKQWKSDVMEDFCKYDASSFEEIVVNARAKATDEFADRLSKYLNVESATKYGNKNAEQQRNSYDTLMKYEIADAIDDVAEQMKGE